MKNKQLMNEMIENKKDKAASRKPCYATRKLSIGLVSCMLGFISLVCLPQAEVSYASEANPIAIEEKDGENLSGGGTESLNNVDKPIPTDDKNQPEQKEDKEEKPQEETEKKVKAEVSETPKAEPKADVENNEAEEETQSTEDKEKSENKTEENKTEANNTEEDTTEDELEVADLKLLGELREPSGEEAGEDVSKKLEDLKVNLYANNESKDGTKVTPLRGPIEANEGQDIGMDISFYVPAGVKKGDYFDIKLSDTVNGYGATSKNVAYKPKLYVGDDVVAEGSYDPTTNTFRYVFTDAAKKYGRFHQDINEVLYVDPKKVKESKNVEVSAKLNGEVKKNFDVDYSLELKEGDVEIPSNGAGTINELNEHKGEGENKGTYEQTYYVNYAGQKQNGTTLTFENDDKSEDHGKTTESEATFDNEVLNSVKVYKVKDPSKLNASFYVEDGDENLEEVAPDQYEKKLITTGNGLKNNGMRLKFNNAGTNDTYVVKYKGKYDPKKFVQIKSTMIANPNESYSSAVHSSTVSLKSSKSNPKADIGHFWENHIFQTLDEDGNVVSTDIIHDFVNHSSGTDQETYRTEKQDVAGYEIYKVENQEGAEADALGNETTGHFVKDKKSIAIYFYRKIGNSYTVWVDEEGNDVKKPENGLKDKIEDPEGYKFVETKEKEKLGNGAERNKHIYHKIVTRYVEEGPDAKELKTKVDGAHPDDDNVWDIPESVSYTHLTLPTIRHRCRSRWSPYH